MINDLDLYNQLRPYLLSNETVLWTGTPATTRMPKSRLFPTVFALFFMAFSVFWMLAAATADGPFFLFGIPFFLAGAGLFYIATFGQKKGLKSSIYAVTETRAIILVSLPRTGVTCKEYVFSNLSCVNLENVKDNIGTIRFEEVNVYHYESGRYGRRYTTTTTYAPERELTTAFVMIRDVHTVYHLIAERLPR